MAATAGLLAPVIDPDRLHRLYRRIPARFRARAHRGQAPADPPRAAARRNAAMQVFYRALAARISPSRFLADAAAASGIPDVTIVPHGIPAEGKARWTGRGPLLFLGSVAWHKGPDLVLAAWRRAFPSGEPGLAVHGPVLDPGLLRGHAAGAVLDRSGVARALADAPALVMGSRWPENAPLVLLEARAAGCPVVAPAIGGIPELVEDGVDGLLYRAGDEQDLVRAMRAVVHGRYRPRPPRTLADQVDQTLAVYEQAGAA